MAQTEYQTQSDKGLDISMTLDSLYELLQNEIPFFKTILEIWDTNQKFQILSYTNDTHGYLLHGVLYSLCDPERADIPGNNPDLIDCVLSGLNGDQRIHLLSLSDSNQNSPFDILYFQKHLKEEVYIRILQKLFEGLTPEQKFKALEADQKGSGFLLDRILCTSSTESLDIIRDRLTPSLFGQLLVTPNRNRQYPLLSIIERENLELLRACLDGISGEERYDLISATCGTTSAITQAVQVSSLDITKALLEGLDETQRFDAYSPETSEQTSPRIILDRKLGRIHDLTELFNASAEDLSDHPAFAGEKTPPATDPTNIEGFQGKVLALCEAISRHGSDPTTLIKNLPDPDLWAIIGEKGSYSTRPIDRAISSGDLGLLSEIAKRTPVSVMKSLLMDGGHPCFSLINLIKSPNTNRVGRLEILLKDFSREDRQELFNAKDQNGDSIQSIMEKEKLKVVNLASCFSCPTPS